jgi:uncharacterized protein YndB with AHSA1/START domain
MDPVTVTTTIARPREQVFEYLADIANHAEFTDHYLKDWHLTREQSVGRGAGARFRVDMPLNRFPWADATLVEVQAPHRLVESGRGGKYNRIRITTEYRLYEGAGETTRVELTSDTEPALLSDRLLEKLGARPWLKRQNARALRRLRAILEDGEQRGRRVTLAA